MHIRIEGLSQRFGKENKALDNLNLKIEPGMFGLLGPNGAGKTTLMRILTLLLSPTSGTVYFDDYDIRIHRKSIRSLIGYLPQDFKFFEKLRTWEYLDYMAGISGIYGKRERREAVDDMLRKVGLYEFRDRWANHLSGGMKRRLGIAQAIIAEPKIVIVDEPTTGLDPEERIRFRNILSEIGNKDVIILLSTHIVGDISSSCKDLALLHRGSIRFRGTPAEMIRLAEDKVWKKTVDDMELEKIKENYPIISTIPVERGWEIEIVADSPQGSEWRTASPNIEHAYVYFMDYMIGDKTAVYPEFNPKFENQP